MRKAPFRCPICNKKGGSITHGVIVGNLQINFICSNPDCSRVVKIYTVKTNQRGKNLDIERIGEPKTFKNISNRDKVSELHASTQENDLTL